MQELNSLDKSALKDFESQFGSDTVARNFLTNTLPHTASIITISSVLDETNGEHSLLESPAYTMEDEEGIVVLGMCFGKDKNINYLNSELDKAPLYRPEIEALKIEISNEFDVALSDFQSKLHAGKVVCQTEEELLASHNSHAADHSEL